MFDLRQNGRKWTGVCFVCYAIRMRFHWKKTRRLSLSVREWSFMRFFCIHFCSSMRNVQKKRDENFDLSRCNLHWIQCAQCAFLLSWEFIRFMWIFQPQNKRMNRKRRENFRGNEVVSSFSFFLWSSRQSALNAIHIFRVCTRRKSMRTNWCDKKKKIETHEVQSKWRADARENGNEFFLSFSFSFFPRRKKKQIILMIRKDAMILYAGGVDRP